MCLNRGVVLIEGFGQQLRNDFADGTAVLLLQVLDFLRNGIVYIDRRSSQDDLVIEKLAFTTLFQNQIILVFKEMKY